MNVQLQRPEVAAKYECTLEVDIIVHAKCYSGRISNVTLCGAKTLVESKTGYLKEKPAP